MILLMLVSWPVLAVTKAGNDAAGSAPAAGAVRHERTAADLVKLKDAGLATPVLVAYVHASRVPYTATADDIVYLKEHGVPEEVIQEWIKTSNALATAVAQAPARSPDLVAAYTPPPPQQPVIVQQQPVIVAAPPTVVAAPPVTYSYPSVIYGGFSWPSSSLYLGFSSGWGWSRPYWGASYYRPHYYGAPWRGGWNARYYGSHFGRGNWAGGHGFYRANYSGGFGRGGHFGGGHFGGGHFGGGHRR